MNKITSFFSKPGATAPESEEKDEKGKISCEKFEHQEHAVKKDSDQSVATPDKPQEAAHPPGPSPSTEPTRKRLRQVESDDDSDVEASSGMTSKEEQGKDADENVCGDGENANLPVKKAEAKLLTAKKNSDLAPMFAKKAAPKPEIKKAKTEEVKKEGEGSGWQLSKGRAKGEASESEAEDDEHTHESVAVLLSSGDFDAAKEASWKRGDPVPYGHLAQAFEKIEGTTKRLEITAILTRALRVVIEISPGDLLACVYLCVNKLAPAHEGIELGLGDMVLKKALAEATGRQEKDIKSDYEKVCLLLVLAMYRSDNFVASLALLLQAVQKLQQTSNLVVESCDLLLLFVCMEMQALACTQ